MKEEQVKKQTLKERRGKMEKPEIIKMTDGSPYNAMFRLGDKVYKAKSHKGTEITFQVIDMKEYDAEIQYLAEQLAEMEEVDLLAILIDALYDLPLDYLKKVKKNIQQELEKSEPKIKTQVDTNYRGTCVNLNVGGKNLVELRH